MTAKTILSQDKVRHLLHYDPLTGIFTRLVRTSRRIKVGDVAGSKNGGGYVQIRIDGVLRQAHRLAWLYMTGENPIGEIDHKNTIPSDNRWENLRDATRKVNMQNQRRPHRNSQLGILGVSRNSNGFMASINIAGKKMYLGTFPSTALAHDAYLKAKRELHEGCTI
jgi:hypothetical protein